MFKCKSKIFAFLFAAALVLAVLPGLKVKADEVKSGTCGAEEGGKNLTWTYDDSTKTLTISGKGKMVDYDGESLHLTPWHNFVISRILISDGVTSIGAYAFVGGSSITNITIPNSVTLIGERAFFGCSNFTSVTIPNSVKTIDYCAFEFCTSLSSITIPKSVETIGEYAFNNCSNLTSVTMDRSLKQQCDSNFVFEDCPSNLSFTYYTNYITYANVKNGKVSGAESLAEIGQTINLTVTPDTGYAVKEVTYTVNGEATIINPDSSGNYSFSMPSCDTTVSASFILSGYCGAGVDRKKLTWTFDESSGILTISGEGEMEKYTNGGAPWYSYRTSIKEIEIVHGVTSISPVAFLDCTNLTSITIPSSITSIGVFAFQNCTSLESVTIPNSVTSIESFVFDSCTNLTSITIPYSVTSIGLGAFNQCSNLKSVTIPSSVTSIGDNAFFLCSNLSDITIPNSVKSIGNQAFFQVDIESLTIPNSVTSIGTGAFSFCKRLTSVTMDKSLKKMCDSNDVFKGCPSNLTITYYTYDITYANVKKGTLSGADTTAEPTQTINLTVTPDTGYAVKEVTYTVNGEATIINPDSSGNYSFSMPSCDTTVSATFIPFGYCGAEDGGKNLTWTFDESTKTLAISGKGKMKDFDENKAPWYSYNVRINTILISDGVTSIGKKAFLDCSSLSSVTIPNSVTKIDFNAFESCAYLSSVTIPNSVKLISDLAFVFCGNLTSVTMDKSLKKICDSNNVFSGCPLNLTFNYYTYDITYADAKNGTVSGKDKSPSTDTITLTVTPDTNYVVDKVTVTDSKETKTIERDASGKYSFVMPSEAVKVEASFKLDSKTVTFESDDGKVLQTITVDCGTSPKYTEAEPAKQDDNDYTYTFAGWKNGTNTYGPKDVLPAVTADITYTAVFNGTAKPKPGTYYLDGISEKDGNIIITVKQTEDDTKTYDLLGTVSSDGTLLTEGTQYTTARGSAIITIQKSYAETLAAGIHKLDVTFTDGGSISINYEVKAAAQSGAANVPATGEGFAAATAIGSIMVIVSCGFIVTVLLRKQRENI